MKKCIIVLIITGLLLTMIGCSSEELGMYSLMKEMSGLDIYENSGTIAISLQGQKYEDFIKEEIPSEFENLESSLSKGFEIRYTMKQKKKTHEFELSLEFRKKGESEFKKLTTVMGNQKVLYIKLDDFFEFIKPYINFTDPYDEKIVNEIINKTEYLEVDLSTYSLDETFNTESKDATNSDQLTKITNEFTDILKEAFSSFSTNLVKKKDNGYELQLEPKDLQPLFVNFVEYVTNNIDMIVDKASKRIRAIPDEDIKLLQDGFDAYNSFDSFDSFNSTPFLKLSSGIADSNEPIKDTIISELEDLRSDVKETTPEDIEEIKNDQYFKDKIKSIEGSFLKYYIGKSSNGNYEMSANIQAKYEDQFTVGIDVSATTKVLSDFSVVKPENTITLEGIKEIVTSVVPPMVNTMKVKTRSRQAEFVYSDGSNKKVFMQAVNKDGYTYLPLRTVGQAFNEKVGWDKARRIPYINKNGEIIEMSGLNMNDLTYVKVRDFQKLGYSVTWNGTTREAIILKPSKYSFLDWMIELNPKNSWNQQS